MDKKLKIKVAYNMVSKKPMKESRLNLTERRRLAAKLQKQIVLAMSSEVFDIENVHTKITLLDEECPDNGQIC